MPYGMAPLADSEYAHAASDGCAAGAAMPDDAVVVPRKQPRCEVAKWETFLNGDSLKQQRDRRAISTSTGSSRTCISTMLRRGQFFRVVRSRTPSGQPIDEIATRATVRRSRRRALLVPAAAVRIDDRRQDAHRLPAQRRASMRTLARALPRARMGSGRRSAELRRRRSRPTRSSRFARCRRARRYQYLLDDAQYFVIDVHPRPVCRGQVAVDVIEDHSSSPSSIPTHDLVGHRLRSTSSKRRSWLKLPAENKSQPRARRNLAQVPPQLARLRPLPHASSTASTIRASSVLRSTICGTATAPTTTRCSRCSGTSTTRPSCKGYRRRDPEDGLGHRLPDLRADLLRPGRRLQRLRQRHPPALDAAVHGYLRMQSENLFLSFLPADDREPTRDSWYVGAGRADQGVSREPPVQSRHRDAGGLRHGGPEDRAHRADSREDDAGRARCARPAQPLQVTAVRAPRRCVRRTSAAPTPRCAGLPP